MAGISSKAAGSLDNKIKFGGKEIQHQEFSDGSGLEWMDFEARMMDGQTGRTNQQDPHSENRIGLTPYAIMSNNPVNRVDPDGKDDDIVQYKDGKGVTQTVNDPSVRGQAQAQAIYGSSAVVKGPSPQPTMLAKAEKVLSTVSDVASPISAIATGVDMATQIGPAAQEIKAAGGLANLSKALKVVSVAGVIISGAQTLDDIGNYKTQAKDLPVHALDMSVGVVALVATEAVLTTIVGAGVATVAAPVIVIAAAAYGISRFFWGPGTSGW